MEQHEAASPTASQPWTAPSAPRVVRHRARIVVLGALTAIILTIIVDQVSRPCLGCVTLPLNASSSAIPSNASSAGGDRCACLTLGFSRLTDWLATSTLLGSIVVTLVLACCAVVLVPAWPLTVGSGAAFAKALGIGAGVAVGSVVVWVGLSMGAVCAFIVARYLLRDVVARRLRRFRLASAIDAALAQEGLKVMTLLRLSPLIPYNVFNYVIAATAVSLRDFALALPAMIPATVGYVYVGATIAEAVSSASAAAGGDDARADESEASQTVRTALLIAGTLATVAAVGILSCVAKRMLDRLPPNKPQQASSDLDHAPPTIGLASCPPSPPADQDAHLSREGRPEGAACELYHLARRERI